MISQTLFEQVLVKKAHYKNIETGESISLEKYQVTFDNMLQNFGKRSDEYFNMKLYKYYPVKLKPHPDCHKIENLIPAIKIVNHYKRGHDLEGFRKYMMTFHVRLSKLPKKTALERTKDRIKYMNTIADLFDIKPDKPFNGKFYFETL